MYEEIQETFDWLGTHAGALWTWGFFLRCMGLIYIIALGPFIWQISALAGSKGLTPHVSALKAYWRDFGVTALWRQPSLYWINTLVPEKVADYILVALPATATLAGLALIFGIGYTPYLIAWCWITLLSIDNGASALMFPWDSLIIEGSFLCLFLPALAPLLSSSSQQSHSVFYQVKDSLGCLVQSREAAPCELHVTADALPNPLLAFAFRYLIARVLIGFGKIKFLGTTDRDRLYIKYFLINQPIVSPLGLLAYHLTPNFVWVASLVVMFIVEMPLPLLAFVPGWPRVAFAVGTVALMFGIMATGNFGYFNVLTITMCIPLLHHTTTIFQTPLELFTTPSTDAIFAWTAVLYIFPASLFYFLMNSWINLSWTYWPTVRRMTPTAIFSHLVAVYRFLAPLRLVQGYGVFPPNSAPPQRWVIQYEASDDSGKTWKPFSLPHVSYAPTVLAPYHARFDHAIFYETLGMNGSNFMGLLVHPNCYGWSFSSPWVRLQFLMAKAFAEGKTALTEPLLERFYCMPQLEPGILLNNGTRVPVPKDILHPSVIPKDWKKEGSSVMIRASLVNAVPASVSTWVKRAWQLIMNRGAKGDYFPLGPAAREGSSPARVAQGTGLVGQLQLAAWEFKHAGSHLSPITAYSAWKDSKGQIHIAADAHTTTLSNASLASGPEDFWWENTYQRQAAGKTQHALSEGQVDRFWEFVAFLRTSALAEAKLRLEKPAAAKAATTPQPARSSIYVVDDIVRTSFTALQTEKPVLKAAIQQFNEADPAMEDALDLSVANGLLVWEALPGIAKRMFAKYSPLELEELRRTYNMLCIPILRASEKVFWRVPPSEATLRREWEQRTTQASSLDEYLKVPDMIDGARALEAADPPYVQLGDLKYHRVVFTENKPDVRGSMKNHARYGMYASWLMLAGGRRVYEHAAADDKTPLVGNRLHTGLNAPDFIGRASAADLFARLCPNTSVSPAHMGDEAGTFLVAMLNYDMFATVAQRAKMMALQGRPTSGPISTPPPFLPGFIEFIQRMSVHDEFLPWDHVNAKFADPIVCPKWGLDVADGSWHLLQQ